MMPVTNQTRRTWDTYAKDRAVDDFQRLFTREATQSLETSCDNVELE